MFTFDYVRAAAAVPKTRPAAVAANLREIVLLARQAAEQHCDLVVFPELTLTGYTCGDLFQQQALLTAALAGLRQVLDETAALNTVLIVGLPLQAGGQLYNTAAVCQHGQVLGLVPKTYLPGYREYYEPRWFASGTGPSVPAMIEILERQVPFGTDLLFRAAGHADFCFGIEICEDMWAPLPPGNRLALQGATILVNPSAGNELIGKTEYRRGLVRHQSAACLSGYVYAGAGTGESTTDMVFSGHCLITENGYLLAESERFLRNSHLTVADIDLDYLQHERRVNTSFREIPENALCCRTVQFAVNDSGLAVKLLRTVDARPFVPADTGARRERCAEIFAIQSTGLATRLEHAGINQVVLGLSGGLDSTLALLVAVEAYRRLELPLTGIHCLTLPGAGTSGRTLGNVQKLCKLLQLELETIDIQASCELHFRDLGHDGKTPDIAFENVQARERTQLLMDKANMLNALVIGTGDLSELALGWCTYNGDHMSMYAVNCGVPKTLVRYLIEFVAETRICPETAAVLRDILATPISPELLPAAADGSIAQKTEDTIGPYELHDFFLYQAVRCGFAPAKVLFLAETAFAGTSYSREQIKDWLRLFYRRFFSQQFKRSCLPDGPKVGTIALSPRGDWRMPSDAAADEWLRQL